MAFETETEAKKVAEKRKIAADEANKKKETVSLDDLFSRIEQGAKEINVILKCDVRGPPGSKPHQWHFPERNRLIAAFSSVVLLAEAPSARSGTIITAHRAIEYGKTLGIYLPPEENKEFFCGNITFLNDEAGFPIRCKNDLRLLLENEKGN